MSVNIHEISNINVQNLRYKLRFDVEMSWYETRIETYQHLVNNTMHNKIDPNVANEFWKPKVYLSNTEEELPLQDIDSSLERGDRFCD